MRGTGGCRERVAEFLGAFMVKSLSPQRRWLEGRSSASQLWRLPTPARYRLRPVAFLTRTAPKAKPDISSSKWTDGRGYITSLFFYLPLPAAGARPHLARKDADP